MYKNGVAFHEVLKIIIIFVLASVIDAKVAKTGTSFLALEI